MTSAPRSSAHSCASTSAARLPVSRSSARPWVRSTTVTRSSAAPASSVSHPASDCSEPGSPSASHSPGPDPASRTSSRTRAACPNGTASARAIGPSYDALTATFASGVQSVIVRAARLTRPLTSQPDSSCSGAATGIGLRASG